MSKSFLNITSRDRQRQNIINCWHSCHVSSTFLVVYHLFDMSSPLLTVMCNCNVYVEAIIIMSGSILRTCCEFRIISPIVKQLQTSGKKQWSTLGFAQLYCSFKAYHYSRTCEINQKLSHRKSRLLICINIY